VQLLTAMQLRTAVQFCINLVEMGELLLCLLHAACGHLVHAVTFLNSAFAQSCVAGPKELLLRLVDLHFPLPPDPDALEDEEGAVPWKRSCPVQRCGAGAVTWWCLLRPGGAASWIC